MLLGCSGTKTLEVDVVGMCAKVDWKLEKGGSCFDFKVSTLRIRTVHVLDLFPNCWQVN